MATRVAAVKGGKLGLRTASEFSWQTKALEREREKAAREAVPIAAALEGDPSRGRRLTIVGCQV